MFLPVFKSHSRTASPSQQLGVRLDVPQARAVAKAGRQALAIGREAQAGSGPFDRNGADLLAAFFEVPQPNRLIVPAGCCESGPLAIGHKYPNRDHVRSWMADKAV